MPEKTITLVLDTLHAGFLSGVLASALHRNKSPILQDIRDTLDTAAVAAGMISERKLEIVKTLDALLLVMDEEE